MTLVVLVAFESFAVATVMPRVADVLDGHALYAFAFAGPLASWTPSTPVTRLMTAPGSTLPSALEAAVTTPLELRSDEALIVAIRSGEPEAFAELYRRYEADARRFARSLVGASDVDDVVSEAFTKVLHALHADKGPRTEPLRYLMVAVRTTAFTVHRRRIRVAEVTERLASEREPQEALVNFSDEELLVAFRSLPDRWRQVIWWSEVEALSPTEIGDRLGLSASAASALAYRARRALRDAYLEARAASAETA